MTGWGCSLMAGGKARIGACAAVCVAIRQGRVQPGQVTVDLKGGRLKLSWDGKDGSPVFLSGPAERVYEGSIVI